MQTFLRMEKCLLPAPETFLWEGGKLTVENCNTLQKTSYYVKNFFALAALILVSPFTLSYDYLRQNSLSEKRQKLPSNTNNEKTVWPPEHQGFATSLFQSSALGTKWSAVPGLDGKSDWDKWMEDPKRIHHEEDPNFDTFFTDYLTDPTAYIKMLKEQNKTSHRFSLEWSVFEPRPGEYDERAITLYKNFIDKLIESDITPYVTLNHFVVPEWFYEAGNFQKEKNVDLYVNYALKAMETFSQVKHWWSFNELGIKAFQQTREVYPTDVPIGSSLAKRVHAAGIATRNMLIAHCKLHQKVEELHPDKEVGVTHQWLKFDTENNNWLERLVAYFFTKFAFSPVYDFFKKGEFAFEFPFMANIHFKVSEEEFQANGKFLQALGVQAYPKPMVKMGLNHGHKYPGLPENINNLPFFSFGGTCEPGGTVMRFGPRWNAAGMKEVLSDAFALTDNVHITEFGSDAMVWKWGDKGFRRDDQAQADYLGQEIAETKRFCEDRGKSIMSISCWGPEDVQTEWQEGHNVRLAVINTLRDTNKQFIGYTSTPASEVLKNAFWVNPAKDNEIIA